MPTISKSQLTRLQNAAKKGRQLQRWVESNGINPNASYKRTCDETGDDFKNGVTVVALRINDGKISYILDQRHLSDEYILENGSSGSSIFDNMSSDIDNSAEEADLEEDEDEE